MAEKKKRKTCEHVFKYRVTLAGDLDEIVKTVKTNVDFFEKVDRKYQDMRKTDPMNYEWNQKMKLTEDMVQNIYFTKEVIQEMKEEICRRIMETPVPFHIFCSDLDGGYYYDEGELLEDIRTIED